MNGFKVSSGNIIMTLQPIGRWRQPNFRNSSRNCMTAIWSLSGDAPIRFWLNRIQTKIFHRMVRSLAGEVARDIGCSVRVFNREILQEINLYGIFTVSCLYCPPARVPDQGDRPQAILQGTHVRTYPLGIYSGE